MATVTPRHTTTVPVLHTSTVKPSGWPRMRSVDVSLQGLTIHSVTVDGEAASWNRDGQSWA